MQNEYLTVTQLTRYIKYKIDNDINLQEVYLKGEISNFKAHTLEGIFILPLKMKVVELMLLCLQVVQEMLNLAQKME